MNRADSRSQTFFFFRFRRASFPSTSTRKEKNMAALLRLAALDSLRGEIAAGGRSRALLASADKGRREQQRRALAAAAASGGREDGSSFTSEDEEGFSPSSSEPPPPPPSAGVTVAAMGMGGEREGLVGVASPFFWFLCSPLFTSPFRRPSDRKNALPSLSFSLPSNASPLPAKKQPPAPSPWPCWASSACSRWPGPWRGARAGLCRRRSSSRAEEEEEEEGRRAACAARPLGTPREKGFFPPPPCFLLSPFPSLFFWGVGGLLCNAMKGRRGEAPFSQLWRERAQRGRERRRGTLCSLCFPRHSNRHRKTTF